MNISDAPVPSSTPAALLSYEAELEFLTGEPDNCDWGISLAPEKIVEFFDDDSDLCECGIWDDEKERELHAEILRELGADLDASRDPSRLWR